MNSVAVLDHGSPEPTEKLHIRKWSAGFLVMTSDGKHG